MLANLPFFCILVPVFAEVTLIRIRANGDSAAANCLKVSRTQRRPYLCKLLLQPSRSQVQPILARLIQVSLCLADKSRCS